MKDSPKETERVCADCGASVEVRGVGDFWDDERAVTLHYYCSKCEDAVDTKVR